MAKRLGVVTIGQSPRTDLVPEIVPLLDAGSNGSDGGLNGSDAGNGIVEHGALDALTADEIAALAPDPGERPLVTRLRDGGSVRVSHARLEPYLRQAVHRAEDDGVRATLLVCTGSFTEFAHRRPLLPADRLLVGGTAAIAGEQRLGVICPEPDQVEMSVEKWRPHAGVPLVEPASPYAEDSDRLVTRAAERLAGLGADILVLDCMGYSERSRAAAAVAGKPIVLARSLVARLAAEVIQR